VYGGTYPAEIWKGVMKAAMADIPEADFPDPPSTTTTTTTTVLGEAVPVPNVEGQAVDQAKAALSAAGFTTKTVNVESDEVPPGTVVNQAPQPGANAPAGSQVTLEVATAPSAAATAVPNVLGLTRDEARSQLVTAGFNVLEVLEPAPAGTTPAPASGRVWKQSPSAGSPKPADGVVQINIQP
jgi:serine/threonine-protein kinase